MSVRPSRFGCRWQVRRTMGDSPLAFEPRHFRHSGPLAVRIACKGVRKALRILHDVFRAEEDLAMHAGFLPASIDFGDEFGGLPFWSLNHLIGGEARIKA